MPLTPSKVRRGAVRRDAMQPRRELGVAAETGKAPVRAEIRLLDNIGRIVLIAGQSQRKREDVGVGDIDEPGERGIVAAASSS